MWLSRRGIRTTRPCEKLSERKLGPFVIKKQINPVAFELCLPKGLRIHPVFHASILEAYVENHINDRALPNPPPVAIDDENQPLFEFKMY